MKSRARSTGEYLRDNQGYRFFWTLIVFARSGRKVYPAMTRGNRVLRRRTFHGRSYAPCSVFRTVALSVPAGRADSWLSPLSLTLNRRPAPFRANVQGKLSGGVGFF